MAATFTADPWHDWPAGGLAIHWDVGFSPPRGGLRLNGELDMATAPLLTHAVQAMVEEGYQHVTADLLEVSFCDVAGLDSLLRAGTVLRARDGQLVVRHLCAVLRRMLEVLTLTSAFDPAAPMVFQDELVSAKSC